MSGDVPLPAAPGDGVELPAEETEGFTREKRRYCAVLFHTLQYISMSVYRWLKKTKAVWKMLNNGSFVYVI